MMLEKAFEAIDIYRSIGDGYMEIKSQNLIGIAYFYNGMYEQASECFFSSLKACDAYDDLNLKSSIYNNLGEVYRESGRYERAFEYYQKGLVESEKDNLTINVASLLGNMGEVALGRRRFTEALEYSTRSCEIFSKSNDMVLLAESENRLGRVYYDMGQRVVAEKLYSKSFQRFEKTKNKFYAVDVLINQAELYSSDDINKAFLHLNNALRYAELSSAKKKILKVYKMFSTLHEQHGDYRMAYDYFKKYHYLERELKISVMGETLEILKLELNHVDVSSDCSELEKIRLRFEAEIEHQKLEMDKYRQKNRELEERVYHDTLTGVSNRSYLDIYASQLLREAQKYKEHFVLFMIDIDKFKNYNDFWGHLQGDECLKRVANAIQSIQERRGDIFGRYGGEEFIYCAKGISYADTHALGELLRKTIEDLAIKNNSTSEGDVVTITLGCSYDLPAPDTTVSDIIGIADEALYQGKRNGRNQVIIRGGE
jgi:diguanylate cyclase (GGDEF)-like protein